MPLPPVAGRCRQLAQDAVDRRIAIGTAEIEAAHGAGITQHRGEVETEAIHAHGVAPVGERIDDQILRHRIIGVVVAAHARVVVRELHVRSQLVVGRVVEAAPGEDGIRGRVVRVPRPALGRMVVHHVDVDLDALVVEGLHHGLELAGRARPQPCSTRSGDPARSSSASM